MHHARGNHGSLPGWLWPPPPCEPCAPARRRRGSGTLLYAALCVIKTRNKSSVRDALQDTKDAGTPLQCYETAFLEGK